MTESIHNPGKYETRESELLSLLNVVSDEEGRMLGRMKLMKLIFFNEHWESDGDKLVPSEQFGGFDDFKIYKYGPFSEELLHTFDRLKELGLVQEQKQMYGPSKIELTGKGRDLAQKISGRFTDEQKMQLFRVVRKFGEQDGNQLEKKSLDYLGITRDEKSRLQGTYVGDLIESQSS